jgi:hypothetical protein
MPPRLASSVLVTGLMRLAEQSGGFGAVLAKGDASAGAVIVVLMEHGRGTRILERILQPDGRYAWQDTGGRAGDSADELRTFLERRLRFDPDLWLVELDVASAERFAAEMNSVV